MLRYYELGDNVWEQTSYGPDYESHKINSKTVVRG